MWLKTINIKIPVCLLSGTNYLCLHILDMTLKQCLFLFMFLSFFFFIVFIHLLSFIGLFCSLCVLSWANMTHTQQKKKQRKEKNKKTSFKNQHIQTKASPPWVAADLAKIPNNTLIPRLTNTFFFHVSVFVSHFRLDSFRYFISTPTLIYPAIRSC